MSVRTLPKFILIGLGRASELHRIGIAARKRGHYLTLIGKNF